MYAHTQSGTSLKCLSRSRELGSLYPQSQELTVGPHSSLERIFWTLHEQPSYVIKRLLFRVWRPQSPSWPTHWACSNTEMATLHSLITPDISCPWHTISQKMWKELSEPFLDKCQNLLFSLYFLCAVGRLSSSLAVSHGELACCRLWSKSV